MRWQRSTSAPGFWIIAAWGLLALCTVSLLIATRGSIAPGQATPETTLERISSADGREILLSILKPGETDRPDLWKRKRPALLYLHGGSWRGGSTDLTTLGRKSTVVRLCETGIVIVGVEYTLARPGAPGWPRALEDARSALRWMQANADSLGVDPERLGVIGFSAGGHLASLLGTMPEAGARPLESTRPSVVIDFYGPADLKSLKAERKLFREPVDLFLGPADPSSASPVAYASSDDPPHLILHGTEDRWVPIEQSRLLAERLGAGSRLIEVEGARHGFEAGVEYPISIDLLPAILAFLQSVWNAR